MARNADFGPLLETLLVCAVTTILVIRTQLYLTDYPQLGGGRWHIAHLLYGGAFMLVAIGVLLMFIGRAPRRPAAVIGGVGFGFFIDELGKFITEDNDYFFRPAAAFIYVIFVALFFLLAFLQRRGALTSEERVQNAIDRLGTAARRRFDEEDRRTVLALLDGADQADPLVAPVRRLAYEVDALPARPPGPVARRAAWARGRVRGVAARPRFPVWVERLYAAWALLSLLAVTELTVSVGVQLPGALRGFGSDAIGDLRVVNVLAVASSVVSVVLVGVGLQRLHAGARATGLRWFEAAVLVSILVTRVFAFVESQFGAVFGLAVDIALLVLVRTVRAEEERDAAAPVALGQAPAVAGRDGLQPAEGAAQPDLARGGQARAADALDPHGQP
jgi:hypothetical protein